MPDPAARRFSVVLAEDDADLRFALRTTLDESGRFVVVGEAGDGAQAVALAGQLRPDVLLLDLSMPVMSGVEALDPIRHASPSTKVVVLSHVPRRRLGRLVLAGGAVGYLEKGASILELPARLLALGGLLELAGDLLAETGVELAVDRQGPQRARRFVEEVLGEWHCDDALDTVRLLVSEVVANAMVHAASDVRIAVQLRPDAVRLVVSDIDPAMPAPRSPGIGDESGRGLSLVETLSTAWGVEATSSGKDVWFEVPRFDAPGNGYG